MTNRKEMKAKSNFEKNASFINLQGTLSCLWYYAVFKNKKKKPQHIEWECKNLASYVFSSS